MIKLNPTQFKKVICDFDSGVSISKLAKKYAYSITGMSHLIKRTGRTGGLSINHNNWPTYESNPKLFLYLLGWLLTDGCVCHKVREGRSRGYTIFISTNDKCIIKFFHKIISPTTKISKYPRIGMSVSKNCAEYFEKWGLIPRKSLILRPTINLRRLQQDDFMQFFVGCVEGDGFVSTKKIKSKKYIYDVPQIGICSASLKFINFIRSKLRSFGFRFRKIEVRTLSLTPDGKISTNPQYNYRISGKEAIRLHKIMMKSSFHLLGRKWNRIKECKDA